MNENDLQFLHGQYYPDYRFRVEKRFQHYYALQYMASGTVHVDYQPQAQTHRGHADFFELGAAVASAESGPGTELSGAWIWPCSQGSHVHFLPGSSGSWEHRYIAFSGPLAMAWQASGLWPQQPQAVMDNDFSQRFDTLLALYQGQGYWTQQRCVNLLEGMLLELAEERAAQPRRRELWLDDCLRQIAANHYQDNDYAQIAASWGMALSTLRRRFKQQMGQSIHRYALQQRLLQAQRLLRETDLPIKALADQLGYNDVFFFSRQFKQQLGVSPGMYRRSKQTS